MLIIVLINQKIILIPYLPLASLFCWSSWESLLEQKGFNGKYQEEEEEDEELRFREVQKVWEEDDKLFFLFFIFYLF